MDESEAPGGGLDGSHAAGLHHERQRRRRSQRVRRRRRVAAATLIALTLLATGAGLALAAGPGGPGATADLDGHQVPVGPDTSVRDLLRSADLSPDGPTLRAAVSHRLLPGHRAQAVVLVDGRPAGPGDRVRPGARVLVKMPGPIEPVATLTTSRPAGGLPDVERTLWHPGGPEVVREVVGAVSGEVVSSAIASPGVPAQPESGKVVALTFDDGPDPRWTPAILRTLAAEGVPATFCLIGYEARKYPALVRAEVAQGETVCDHTFDHDEHLGSAPASHVVSEIQGGADAVSAAGGVRPAFYRPPGGSLSSTVVATAHARGLRILYWSVDPSDYLRPPALTIVARVMERVKPGAIIELHDGGGDRSQTVAALRPLIEALRAEGYSFTTPALEDPVNDPPASVAAAPRQHFVRPS